MSKVKVYQDEKSRPYSASYGNYVKGTVVRDGQTLFVSHMAGSFKNIGSTEYVELGYWNGHAYVPIKKDKPANTDDFVFWNGKLWLREGQCVYAYFADAADGELMKLRAEGRWE